MEDNSSPLQTILKSLSYQVSEGKNGIFLNEQAERLIRVLGCEPAFLGYKGFPATLCVSINNEVIHGIPDERKFEEGDVIKLDLGLKCNGEYDDGALTVIVGRGSAIAKRLVKATQEALDAGIAEAKEGNTTHDIAQAISRVARREKFGIIKGFGGHGIGRELHMPPFIPNEPIGEAVPLTKGMKLAIEPMFDTKRGETVIDKNKWTVKLIGGGVAAHFERTVTVE
jgi:methionyl aminopeptidase